MSRPPVDDFNSWLRDVQRRLIDLERRPIGGVSQSTVVQWVKAQFTSNEFVTAVKGQFSSSDFITAVKGQFTSSDFITAVKGQFSSSDFKQSVENTVTSKTELWPRTVRVTWQLNAGTYNENQTGNYRVDVPGLTTAMNSFVSMYGGAANIDKQYPLIYYVGNGYFNWQWRAYKTFTQSVAATFSMNVMFTPSTWHALNINSKGIAVRGPAITYDNDPSDGTVLPVLATKTVQPRVLPNGHVDGQHVFFVIDPSSLT